jgi:hypothetical protein
MADKVEFSAFSPGEISQKFKEGSVGFYDGIGSLWKEMQSLPLPEIEKNVPRMSSK